MAYRVLSPRALRIARRPGRPPALEPSIPSEEVAGLSVTSRDYTADAGKMPAVSQTPSSLPTSEDLIALLRGVVDPELGSDIVDLGMVRSATSDESGNVVVTIALTTSGCPLRAQIQRDIRARIGSVPGVTDVRIEWTEMTQEQKSSAMAKARFNVSQREQQTSLGPTTRVVMVASGKGGVGKSSVTVNLAAAMAARGLTVGVLDADVWGFSVPRMFGLEGRLGGSDHDGHKMMVPLERAVGDGVVRVVSMGFLVEDE